MAVLSYMKTYIIIPGLLALSPFYIKERLVYFPIYSYLVASLIAGNALYVNYFLIRHENWSMLDLAFFLVDFTSVYSILRSVRCKDLQVMLRVFKNFDFIAKSAGVQLQIRDYSLLYLLLTGILNGWNIYFEFTIPRGPFVVYLFIFSNYYLGGCTLICGVMVGVQGRLRLVNEYLEHCNDPSKLLTLHDMGCVILEKFNQHYGWQLLLYVVCALAFSLRNLVVAIYDDYNINKLENLVYVIFVLGATLTLLFYGENIKQEMQTTASKSRSFSLNLAKRNFVEATLLVQQTSLCCSNVTAAGFLQ